MMSDDTTTLPLLVSTRVLGSTTAGSNLPAKKYIERETEGEVGGLYLVRTAALF